MYILYIIIHHNLCRVDIPANYPGFSGNIPENKVISRNPGKMLLYPGPIDRGASAGAPLCVSVKDRRKTRAMSMQFSGLTDLRLLFLPRRWRGSARIAIHGQLQAFARVRDKVS